ncbi:MAG: SAM-dependent DNA methyltransferase [Myxococcales bacterium]|nr:SAM-dependent DNA methyltransferase [Myxococcales bacterium]
MVNGIWQVAELLRGDYRQSEYGRVILPFVVLRRLDQAMEATRAKVRERAAQLMALPPQKDADGAVTAFDGVQVTFGESSPYHKLLSDAAGSAVYNVGELAWDTVDDGGDTDKHLIAYLKAFSPSVQQIFEHFRFTQQVTRLRKAGLLGKVLKAIGRFDLRPSKVTNHQMGTLFEELIRRFSEVSNETAGEHFTPREVIRLMVQLLFADDEAKLKQGVVTVELYDPACGTGGMLSVGEEALLALNSDVRLTVYGQELNDESYAICRADLLLKGQNVHNIKLGNTFIVDHLEGHRFDYLISNPPFGVDWSKAQEAVRREHKKGDAGRFAPGLPRKSDGSLLFLLHMLHKLKPVEDGGGRIAIVLNGSPLFSGAAGSGESEIRRYVLENDLLEAIVALPDQMFYNTGINTYVWVLTNRKPSHRQGKVQLINGVDRAQKMRKSLGNKRKELGEKDIAHLKGLYDAFAEVPGESRLFDNEDFGFRRITVERPLRLRFEVTDDGLTRLDEERAFAALATSRKKKDAAGIEKDIAEGEAQQEAIRGVLETLRGPVWIDRAAFRKALTKALKAADLTLPKALRTAVEGALSERDPEAAICRDAKGRPEPDADLRDYENVPLKEDIDAYMAREVLPHVPDAWVDGSKTKVGYEIPFTRHFYVYEPPRALEVIEGEIAALEAKIVAKLGVAFE